MKYMIQHVGALIITNDIFVVLGSILFLTLLWAFNSASRALAKNNRRLIFTRALPITKIWDLIHYVGRNVNIHGRVFSVEYSLTAPKVKFTVGDDTGRVSVVVWDDILADEIKGTIKRGADVEVIGHATMFSGAPCVYVSGMGHSVTLLPQKKLYESGLPALLELEVEKSYDEYEFLGEKEKKIINQNAEVQPVKEEKEKKESEERAIISEGKESTPWARAKRVIVAFILLGVIFTSLIMLAPGVVYDEKATIGVISPGHYIVLSDGRKISFAGIFIENLDKASYIVNKLCLPGSSVYLDIDDLMPLRGDFGRAVVYAVADGSLVNINKMLVDERCAVIREDELSSIRSKDWWTMDRLSAASKETVITGTIVLLFSFLGHVCITYVCENRGKARVTGMRSKRAALLLALWTFFSAIALLSVWVGSLLVLVRLSAEVWALIWIIVFALAFSIRTVFINDLLGGLIAMCDSRIDVGREIEVRDRRGVIIDVSLRRTLILLQDGSEYIVPNGQLANLPYVGTSKVLGEKVTLKAPTAEEPLPLSESQAGE